MFCVSKDGPVLVALFVVPINNMRKRIEFYIISQGVCHTVYFLKEI